MPAKQKWQMASRVEEKRERKADQDKAWREVTATVRAREAHHCRLCGRRCSPSAVSMLDRGDVHHLTYRSRGGDADSSNLALLCRGCHADIHAGKLRVEGNADECLTVWRRTDEGWHQVIRETPTGVERD
jgi:Pyruvate/2-oxoacid:ferredoxin oxidoreductase delta subunit